MIEYTIKNKEFTVSEKGDSYAFLCGSYSPSYQCSQFAVDAATWAAYKVGDKINIAVSAVAGAVAL